MSDPRVELVQAVLNIAEADIYVEDASDALASLAREAQLARAVVEAAEAEKRRRTGGMGMLADYEDNTADALAAYRAEFPQEPSA